LRRHFAVCKSDKTTEQKNLSQQRTGRNRFSLLTQKDRRQIVNFKTQLGSRLVEFFGALLLTLLSVNFTFAQSGTSSVKGTMV
jgi:hypothetical protein